MLSRLDKIPLIAKGGKIVWYPVEKYKSKPINEIARELGYESTFEFAHYNYIIAFFNLPRIGAGIVIDIAKGMIERYESDYEAISNHWGE